MISPVYRVGGKTETEPGRKKPRLGMPLAIAAVWGLSQGYFTAPELEFGLGGVDQYLKSLGRAGRFVWIRVIWKPTHSPTAQKGSQL